MAQKILTDPSGRHVEGLVIEKNGEMVHVRSPLVVVSCGAVNSAVLLLRSASDKHPQGLANSSGLVGRRYMAHLATMMQCFCLLYTSDAADERSSVGLGGRRMEGCCKYL